METFNFYFIFVQVIGGHIFSINVYFTVMKIQTKCIIIVINANTKNQIFSVGIL